MGPAWWTEKIYTHVLTLRTCDYYLSWKKGLCRCDSVKNLERRCLSWIVHLGFRYNHRNRGRGSLEKRHRKGEGTMRRTQRLK